MMIPTEPDDNRKLRHVLYLLDMWDEPYREGMKVIERLIAEIECREHRQAQYDYASAQTEFVTIYCISDSHSECPGSGKMADRSLLCQCECHRKGDLTARGLTVKEEIEQAAKFEPCEHDSIILTLTSAEAEERFMRAALKAANKA